MAAVVLTVAFGMKTDAVTPVVGNQSPVQGSTVSAADPVFFDMTDMQDIELVIVAVEQDHTDSLGNVVTITEVAWNGSAFVAPYDALSLQTGIDSGLQFRLRRSGGWLSDVTVRWWAVDTHGNSGSG